MYGREWTLYTYLVHISKFEIYVWNIDSSNYFLCEVSLGLYGVYCLPLVKNIIVWTISNDYLELTERSLKLLKLKWIQENATFLLIGLWVWWHYLSCRFGYSEGSTQVITLVIWCTFQNTGLYISLIPCDSIQIHAMYGKWRWFVYWSLARY